MQSSFERIRSGSLFLVLLLVASTLAIVASSDDSALASVPGTNGTIAFERDGDIWTMSADGSGAAVLYEGGAFPSIETEPAYSPDGSMIAFSSNRGVLINANSQIWIMDNDGSNESALTTAIAADSFAPSWSPDGNWIVFERLDPFTSAGTATAGTTGTKLFDDGQTFDTDGVEAGMEITVDGKGTTTIASVESDTELTVAAGLSADLAVGDTYTIKHDRYYLFLMDKDGNNLQNLSTGAGVAVPGQVYSDFAPKWSPKGDQIAFATGRNSSIAALTNDIYVATINPAVTPALSGLTNLTPDPAWFDSSEDPEWSPDAAKLVFEAQRAPGPGTDLWIMDEATGAAGPRIQLTDTTLKSEDATWSPDGASIVFSEGGNLFSVSSAGGTKSPLTSGTTVDRQPNFDRELVATDDTYPTTIGGTVTMDAAEGVLENDVGLAGNPLATIPTAPPPTPTNGTVTLNADGSFTFTHDGSDGDGSFTYKVKDAGGNISNTATVTIDTPFNAPPVANPNGYVVDAGGTLTVPAPGVLGNDTDAEDGVPGTAVLVAAPAHNDGTFTLNANGSFTYTHDGSAGTSDSFTYRAEDSLGKPSNVAKVTITITMTSAVHTVGLVDPGSGKWYLYDAAGVQKAEFFYGNPGDYPIYGDWNGDGVETPGLYRQSDGYVYLRNSAIRRGLRISSSSSGTRVMSRLRVTSTVTVSTRCRSIGRRIRRSTSSTSWGPVTRVWVLRTSRMCSAIRVTSRSLETSTATVLRPPGCTASRRGWCISVTPIRRAMRMHSSSSAIRVTGSSPATGMPTQRSPRHCSGRRTRPCTSATPTPKATQTPNGLEDKPPGSPSPVPTASAE